MSGIAQPDFIQENEKKAQCRCCLKWSSVCYGRLVEGADSLHLRHMLQVCTGLLIGYERGFPEDICDECTPRLHDAFKFREQCHESDANIRVMSQNSLDNKNELFICPMDFENSPDICDTFDDRNSCEDYLPLQCLKDIKNSGIVENIKPETNTDENNIVAKVKKKKKRTDEEKLAKKLKKLTKQNLVQNIENGNSASSDATQHNKTTENNSKLDIKIEIDDTKVKNESEIITNPEKTTEKNIKELYYNSDSDNFPVKKKTRARTKGQYFCDICGHCVKVKWDLITHFRRHTGEKPYKCETCGKSFAHDGALRSHQNQHTGTKNFICDICGKALSTKDTLLAHRRMHTGELPFTCATCGRSFRALTNLRAHRKIHTGDKRHPCPTCNKLFYTKSDMRDHARRHTGERPYACTLCPQRFTGKSNFRLHMKIHAGQKDFECPDCPKTFVSRDSLRRHSRTHSGERAFECIECGRRFAHRSSLVSHHAIHSKTKDYVCDICSQRFGYASGLYVHRKKKHNIQSNRLVAPIP